MVILFLEKGVRAEGFMDDTDHVEYFFGEAEAGDALIHFILIEALWTSLFLIFFENFVNIRPVLTVIFVRFSIVMAVNFFVLFIYDIDFLIHFFTVAKILLSFE